MMVELLQVELVPFYGRFNEKESTRQGNDSVVGLALVFPDRTMRSKRLLFSYSSLMVARTN